MEIRIDDEDRAAHLGSAAPSRPHSPARPGFSQPEDHGPASTAPRTVRSAGAHHQHRATRKMLVQYSRFVRAMKVALPALAAALVGLVMIWPKVAPQDHAFKEAFRDFNVKSFDMQSMQNPHYYGTDNQNQPFSLTANYATQVDLTNNVISLDSPVADFSRKDGSSVIISSESGLYRQKEDVLDLLGKVDVYQDNGFEMHTNSARLFAQKGEASGDEPTHAQNLSGIIDGEGFRLVDRGRTIIFTGKTKAVLYSSHGGKSSDKSAKANSGKDKP